MTIDTTDLKLVPIEDLIKEAESRCSSFIAAYETYKEHRSDANFQYGKGTWFMACYLSNILNNDILNNWNGELQKIQRILTDEDWHHLKER